MEICKIKLTYKKEQYEVLITQDDYEKIKGIRWHICNCSRHSTSPKLYVRHHTTRHGKHIYTYLHRVIANALPGVVVDHINSNSLDCRKQNLRLTSVKENARRQNHALQRKRGF